MAFLSYVYVYRSLILKLFFFVFVICLLLDPLHAEEPMLHVGGQIVASKQLYYTASTDLVPLSDTSDSAKLKGGADVFIRPQLDWAWLSLKGRLRTALDNEDIDKLHVDEAYAEMKISDYIFVQGGRRLLSHGQSYGLNPSDIFQNPLRENNLFPREISNSFVEGSNYAEVEVLFDIGSTLGLIYAPSFDFYGDGDVDDLIVLRYSGLALEGVVSYETSFLGGKRPGTSLSLSSGLGLDSILYLDATIRKGRDRLKLGGIASSGKLTVESRDEGTYYPFITLGFGYTFTSGLTSNLEYTYAASGYSQVEWSDFMSTLNALTPVKSVIQDRGLAQLNGLLGHHILRQNYIFWRFAQDNIFGSPFNGELTILHNIDDGSGSSGIRWEYPATEVLTFGMLLSSRYGKENTEFTLRPEGNRFFFYGSMTF